MDHSDGAPSAPAPITPRTRDPQGNATERRLKKSFWITGGLMVLALFVIWTGLFSKIAPPPSPSSARAMRQDPPNADADVGQTRTRLESARPNGVTLTFGAKVENGQGSPAAPGREDASISNEPTTDRGREILDSASREALRQANPPGSAGTPLDRERDERRRLEQQSLFAGSLIDLTRKKGGPVAHVAEPSQPPDDRAPLGDGTGSRPIQMPSADDLVQSVMREMKLGQNPTPPAAKSPSAQPSAQPGQPQMAPSPPPVPPPGHHRVYTDQILDVTLMNRLTGDAPGPVIGALAFPLYAKDGTKVLPKGAQLVGLAQSADAEGQTRVGVGFHRVIVIQPDGYTVKTYDLDRFPGMNQIGDVGLQGDVNRHYLRTFGLASMVGIVTAVPSAITNGINGGLRNNGVVFAGGMADSTGQAVSQTLNRLMAQPWELNIPEGKRLKVAVMSDLDLPAYVDTPHTSNQRSVP